MTFKNKVICIRRKIFIFFSLKKKKKKKTKTEMAQGRWRPKAGYLPLCIDTLLDCER